MKIILISKQTLAVVFVSFFLPLVTVAQTQVVKRSIAQSNNYGVNYFLPKSMLEIRARVAKIEKKAGPYYKYAEKFLGITDIVKENQTYYELEGVEVFSRGVPDKEKSYLVELKSKTTAPFVYLTESGLICTINAEYVPEEIPSTEIEQVRPSSKLSAENLFTEEYMQAGSTAKMAEVAAKQIYKIRESRMDILTGNSDNAPRDGAALKLILEQLENQEKALVELFAGSSGRSVSTISMSVEPNADMEKEVIFRFSKYLGVVSNDDLSGAPVYINLKKIDLVEPIDYSKKKEKSLDKGIFYNIPGQGVVEVYYGTNQICKTTLNITQFGTTQVLASPIFEDKKAPVKVYFYPETGGIKKIEQ